MFTILFISSAYVVLVPNVHAVEMTNQQKGISISGNVVGLDLTKYTVKIEETHTDSQASYLGVVPQENVAYNLNSDGSKIKMLYTFADGKLQMIHVLEREGLPSLIETATSANDVDLAKVFLSKYQTYTANPLFGELKSTLDNVDAGKNVTKTSGNTVLEVSATDGHTTFKWYYTSNGAIAPYSKFVALGFRDGFLSAFVDNWQLYNVASTSVNLSKEEAIAIALEAAKAHSWSLKLDEDTLDVKNFNESNVRWTALILDGSLDADNPRSEDPLALYPVWRVGIALNKWYGYMYGIQVDIWADTKEARSVQEAWSTMPPPEGVPTANLNSQASLISEANPNLTMLTTFPTLATAMIGIAIVWASRKKKTYSYNLRPRGLKTGGVFLCVLISSTVLLEAITTVNAATRDAVIWGSESTGAYDPNIPGSWKYWRKSQSEVNLQRYVSNNIRNYFASNDYDSYNRQGYPGSLKSSILSYITYLKDNYAGAAVVDFDHGMGRHDYSQAPGEFHFLFEDNVGTIIGPLSGWYYAPDNGVYDMDIYPLTETREIFFAFINTCGSANLTNLETGAPWQGMGIYGARGLPFAFTHRYVKWRYAPDFNVATDISNYGYHYPDDGPHVYIGFPWGSPSLEQHIPKENGIQYQHWVNSFFYYALFYDMSVNQALDHASWQHWGAYFGNSPLWTGYQAYWWPVLWPRADSTMAVYGNGNIHLKTYVPTDFVTTPSVSGPTSGGIGISYQFSASSTDSYGHNVRYTFDWGDGSPQTVTGWYASGATAYASHSWSSAGQFSVRVKAQCENGAWSGWSSPHTIVIGNVPVLTVNAFSFQYGELYGVPVWIDGGYVGTTPYSGYVSPGSHQIQVPNDLYFTVFQYYYYDGIYNYNNPMTLSITSDKAVTAYYY